MSLAHDYRMECHGIALECHPDSKQCICRGCGYTLTDFDTWEACRYHAGRNLHPNEIDSIYCDVGNWSKDHGLTREENDALIDATIAQAIWRQRNPPPVVETPPARIEPSDVPF